MKVCVYVHYSHTSFIQAHLSIFKTPCLSKSVHLQAVATQFSFDEEKLDYSYTQKKLQSIRLLHIHICQWTQNLYQKKISTAVHLSLHQTYVQNLQT